MTAHRFLPWICIALLLAFATPRTFAAVNLSPLNVVPGAQGTDEDQALIFATGNGNQIQVSDPDAGSASVRITLSVTHGALTLAGTNGLSFTTGDGTTDASMVFTGSLADINVAVATLIYEPTTHFSGSDTLTLVTDDQGHTGTGVPLNDTDTVSITVYPINDAPVANNDLAWTPPGVPLDVNVKANDLDVDNVPADLTVSLVANSDGTSASVTDGSINFDPGATNGEQTVTYQLTDPDGLTSSVATLTINVEGNDLPTSSDSSATVDEDASHSFHASEFPFDDINSNGFVAVRIETLPVGGALTFSGYPVNAGQVVAANDLIHLVFTPTENLHGWEYTSFSFSVQDSIGAYSGNPNTFTINVDPLPDAPTATELYQSIGYTEDGGAVALGDIVVSDPDYDEIVTATLTLSNTSGGSLSTGVFGSTTSTYNTNTGGWMAVGTLADVNAALAAVAFTPAANYNADLTIAVQVYDAIPTGMVEGSLSLNGTAVNDAPTITATGLSPTFTEGGVAVALFGSVEASTIEAGQTFSGLTFTITNVTQGVTEFIAVGGTPFALTHANSGAVTGIGSFSVSVTNETATVSVTGMTRSALQMATLLNGVAYMNTVALPNVTGRVFTLTSVTDSGGVANGGVDTTTLELASTVTIDRLPLVAGRSVPTDPTYRVGQAIDFTVTWSEIVNVVTTEGTPYVGVTLGTDTKQAAYVSGSGTATLTFRYTVASGDLDSDGIAAASSITLNEGTIKDANGNNAPTTSLGFASTETVTVEGVVPTVSAIDRVTAEQTNATSLSYAVTFSESVTGVNSSDFTVTTTDGAEGSIAGVSGSGSAYTVTVDTISGNGTLRMDLKDTGTGITDTPGNAIAAGFTSGQTYTIDTTTPEAPTAVALTPVGGTVVAKTLNTTSTNLTATATIVAGEATGGRAELYIGSTLIATDDTILVGDTSVTFDVGTSTTSALQLAVAAGGVASVTLYDVAANMVTSSVANPTLIVTYTVPTAPTGVTLTPVGGTVIANTLNATSTNLIATATIIAGDATGGTAELYLGATLIATDDTILVGDASVTFDVGTSTTSALQLAVTTGGVATVKLYDASANTSASSVENPTLTVDYVAPLLSGILRQTPASVNVSATTVTWRVTFSEAVTGVDANDFALTVLDGTVAGTIGTATPVSTSIYDVEVHTISGQGQLRLDLVASGTETADLAGNTLADGGFTAGDGYVIGDASVFDAMNLNPDVTALTVTTTAGVAQRFTTSSSAPLTVKTVTALLRAVTDATPLVRVYTSVSNTPGTLVATLTNPTSLEANALNVWQSNAPLSGGTTYWLVFSATAGSYEIEASTGMHDGGTGAWLTEISDYKYLTEYPNSTLSNDGALQVAIGATNKPSITNTPLTANGTYRTAFTYQVTATNTPTSYSATGLPTGLSVDAATGIISGTATQTGSFNVSLTATNDSGTGAPATLTLTIGKAGLTATADSVARIFGHGNPSLPISYTGLLGGDSAGSLTTQPTTATSATSVSPAGAYAITVAGGASDNYAFNYVAGVLTVNAAVQVINFPTIGDLLLGQSATLSATSTSGLPVAFSIVAGPASLSGGSLTTTGVGPVTVRASQAGSANYTTAPNVDRSFNVTVGSATATTPTQVPAPSSGGTTELSVGDTNPNLVYQWQRNGADLAGATGGTLTLDNVQPITSGLYTYTATVPGGGGGTSEPLIIGLASTEKVGGTAEEVGSDIVHPNGNVYDQMLLDGPAATITADPNKVTRLSFIDLSGDIVQVEFSGAGTVSLIMDNASTPAPAVNYTQPGVDYVRGHAGIVITGADETTNISVFTVGRITAVNQTLFIDEVDYDGVADIAFIAIQSSNGKFGGIRTGNVNYFASEGFTGIYAPGVEITGPMNIGEISAFDDAHPLLVVGSASVANITGGNLAQPNGQPVKTAGLADLNFIAGMSSQGTDLPAQANAGVLEQDGVDVTDLIVGTP